MPAHPRMCLKDSLDRSVLLERSVETPWIAVEIGKRQIDRLDRSHTHPHLCRRIRRTTLLHTAEFLIYMSGCGTPGDGNLHSDCGRDRGEAALSPVSGRRIYRRIFQHVEGGYSRAKEFFSKKGLNRDV